MGRDTLIDEESKAYETLRYGGYRHVAGVIYHPHPEHVPTTEEYGAIDHLCDEWDYGWVGTGKPPPDVKNKKDYSF